MYKSMKKQILFIGLIISMLSFFSCKKCDTCQCWKDGVEYEQKNCSYGFPPNSKTLKVWEDYLVEVMGYDSVRCTID